MKRSPSRVVVASALVAGAIAGCTLVLGDGTYHVAADGGLDSGAPPLAEAGTSDASDAAAIEPDGALDDAGPPGPCSAGARRCAGGGVETCASDGGWGAPVACATGSCASGGCSGATASAPSCTVPGPGRTNCGEDGGEICCLSEEIPGGTYPRTFGPDGGKDPATVSGFRLDKYLVTVGRFREFFAAVGANKATPDAGAGKHSHLNGGRGLANVAASGKYESGWAASDDAYITFARSDLSCDGYATWTADVGSHETLPINCVSWFEAYAFCIWDGGFLPSEAEREYAAAGGSAQRPYPGGDASPGTTNQYAIYGTGGSAPDCNYPGPPQQCTGTVNIAPVGTPLHGAGLWGQADLGGDISEWDLDYYWGTYLDPCVDCAYLNSSDAGRAIRGGAFKYAAFNLASNERYGYPPLDGGLINLSDTWGIRCARVP